MPATEEVGAKLKLKDRRRFVTDARRAEEAIEDVGDEAAQTARKSKLASGALAGLRGGLGLVKKAARVAVTGLVAASLAVGGLSIKTVQLGMDAAETASAFTTVFGPAVQEVGGFVDDLNERFGIPTEELQRAATEFGVFGKAAGVAQGDLSGFTTELVGAGLDLASFYNADPSEVFGALRSGLAGEAEPLRRFGIFLSQATMEAKAAQMGLSGELDEAQKVMVRQAIIMESLGDAQGDMARTADGLANQWRGLKGRLQEAGTVIGTALLPYASDLVVELNDRLQPAVAWLEDHLPDMLEAAESHIVTVVGHSRDLASAWAAGDMDTAVQLLDAMAGGSGDLVGPLGKVVDVGQDLAAIWSELLYPAFQDVKTLLPFVVSPLTMLDDVLSFVADNTETLYPLVVALTGAWVAYKTVTLATAAAQAIMTAKTWLLNAALAANPIGLVVAVLAGLALGLVKAYRTSEDFRRIVDRVFSAVKVAGLTMAKVVVQGLRFLVDKFLAAAEWITKSGAKAFGWVPGIGDKLNDAADWVEDFRDDVVGELDKIEGDIDVLIKAETNQFFRAARDVEQMKRRLGMPIATTVGGTTIGTGITQRQHGGPVWPGSIYMVGERGPELFQTRVPGIIHPEVPSARDSSGATDPGGDAAMPGPLILSVQIDRREVGRAVLADLDDRRGRRS